MKLHGRNLEGTATSGTGIRRSLVNACPRLTSSLCHRRRAAPRRATAVSTSAATGAVAILRMVAEMATPLTLILILSSAAAAAVAAVTFGTTAKPRLKQRQWLRRRRNTGPSCLSYDTPTKSAKDERRD